MNTESSVLLPPQGQRILIIMAHPDDAEFICGGTIARLVDEGRDVFYVLVTSGNRGSHEVRMTMERLGKIREDEQRHAAEVLGVREVAFLGFEWVLQQVVVAAGALLLDQKVGNGGGDLAACGE